MREGEGNFCPLENLQQRVETFLVVTTGERKGGGYWHPVHIQAKVAGARKL